MKKSTSLKTLSLAFLMLSFMANVWGQAIMIENFDYPVGSALTSQGWTAHSGAGTNAITVAAPSITHPGYLGSGVGNVVTLTTSGEDVNRTFAAQTSGTVYVAFLVNITSSSTIGDYFFHVGQTSIGTAFRGRVFVRANTENKLSFGISQSTTTTINYSGFIYDLNTTYLIVLRYEILDGASNDVASIFVNPTLNAPLPTSGWITNTDAAGTDLAQLGSIALRQGTAANASALVLDGIRVSANWADIVGEFASTTPTLTANPTSISGLNYIFGSGPSASQSFVLSGSNLSPAGATITINAPSNFVVSLDGTSFGPSQSVNATGGNLSQTIRVRLVSNLVIGNYSNSLLISGGGAPPVAVGVNGSVTADCPPLAFPFFENFTSPVGSQLAFYCWSAHSGVGSNPFTVSAPTITYPGYLGSGIGNEVTLATSGEDINRKFLGQTSGTVYASFLVRVTSATTEGDYFLHVGANEVGTAFRGRVFVRRNEENKLAFGIAQNTTTANYSPFNYDLNTTYLIVLRYEIMEGVTNDVASIFVNPTLNAPLPTSGWVANTDAAGTDLAQVGTIALRQGGSTSAAALILDGIRVSSNWADIVGLTSNVAPTTIPEFSIFPNPTLGDISVRGQATIQSLRVLNMLGQQVLGVTSVDSHEVKLPTSNLKAGYYIISVTDVNGNTINNKFLKR